MSLFKTTGIMGLEYYPVCTSGTFHGSQNQTRTETLLGIQQQCLSKLSTPKGRRDMHTPTTAPKACNLTASDKHPPEYPTTWASTRSPGVYYRNETFVSTKDAKKG